MGTSDGFVVSNVKVVDHGDDALRFNIVILGDGYRASELAKFHADTDSLVNTLRATAPYHDLWCALNIYRVDVVSTDSGADDPGTCGDGSGGSGATPATFFDATFCGDDNTRRLLTCDSSLALSTAHSVVAHPSMTMVIVNTSEYGGSGGSVATLSTHPDAAQIALHEMGHTAFHFADEYEYLQGCGTGEAGHDHYGGGEPFQPNVTIDTDRNTMKWRTLLTSATDALPTTHNANCADCDPQPDPHGAGYVGAYEGANTFHCGCFRASFDCKMRKLANSFCAVCQQVIRDTLSPFLPDAMPILITPNLNFQNIPEGVGGTGVTTFRAIVFELDACMAASRHLHISAGPTGGFGTPLGTTAELTSTGGAVVQARIWLSFTSGAAGTSAHGSVTVHCDETGQDFVIPIDANTVARPKSAIALVLDHSFSMTEDAGDGTTKVDKLREAATILIGAMLPGDGLSVVRFDDTAQTLMPVTDVGPVTVGAGRLAALGHLGSEIDPAGDTSIGAGVVNGKATLDAAQAAASPRYDNAAMLVLTDGVENTAPMLIDVRSSITASTFAVGLGRPENISVAALSSLTQAHNGYVLVTGTITPDQAARLNKYFLQILAGATNANVILDPHGELTPGAEHRIPFWVSESDISVDAFLLAPVPGFIDFQLETPDGTRITPGSAGGNIQFVPGPRVSFYRLALPALPGDAAGSHSGRWNIVLRLARIRGQEYTHVTAAARPGLLPYDVVVHCRSNLVFGATLVQTSFEPGAIATVAATLREYDVPVDGRATVWAEVTRPDASVLSLAMPRSEPGHHSATFVCSRSGLYNARVRAKGTTFYGSPFQREQTLSAAVYPGGGNGDGTGGPRDDGSGDHHPGTTGGSGGGGDPFWCDIVRCLLGGGVISSRLIAELTARGLDLKALLACIEKHCRGRGRPSPCPGTALSSEAVSRIAEVIARELGG
jgi:IgA peptidase M64/VWA domain-containing protein